MRTLTAKPFGVNLLLHFPVEEQVAICLEEQVPILSLFWGDPTPLDLPHGMRERGPQIGGGLADIAPMTSFGNVEPVDLGKLDRIDIAVDLSRLGGFLIPDVTDPLEEQEREDVRLPVCAVDGTTAEDLGTVPEVGLELLQVMSRLERPRGRA